MIKKHSVLISVVILHRNTFADTKDCLESLFSQSYENIEVIIVDNGSEDTSVNRLKKLFPSVIWIKNKNNRGFAEANNQGIKKSTGSLVLILNNDTIVDKNFLDPLTTALLSDNNLAAVQPTILKYPEEDLIDSVGSYFTASGFLYHKGHNKKYSLKYKETTRIFSMKGACMLIKKDVLESVGLFDEDYFAYFEETDLCHRMLLAGYSIKHICGPTIFHKGGITSKKMGDDFINFHSYKNRIYTYLKNFQLSVIFRVLPIHIFLIELAGFAYLATGNFKMFTSIHRAIFWNVSSLRKIRKKRKEIQKMRKVLDNTYLPVVQKSVRISYYYHLFATALSGYHD